MAFDAKVKLESMKWKEDSNAFGFSFWVTNVDPTEIVDLSNYRICMGCMIPWEVASVVSDTETGFANIGSLSGGSLSFEAAELIPHYSQDRPMMINPALMTVMAVARLSPSVSSLTEGQGIGDLKIKFRNLGYNNYPLRYNGIGPGYLYEESLSLSTALPTYAADGTGKIHSDLIWLEYNDTDPGDNSSTNWQVVQQWDSSTTELSVTETPYGELNCSDGFDTYTDHRMFIPTTGLVDILYPDTDFYPITDCDIRRQYWDGSGLSTTRALLEKYIYDTEVFPSGGVAQEAKILFKTSDISNQPSGEIISLYEFLGQPSEEGFNWNSMLANIDTSSLADFTMPANGYDAKDMLMTFDIPASSIERVFDTKESGLVLRLADEDSTQAVLELEQEDTLVAVYFSPTGTVPDYGWFNSGQPSSGINQVISFTPGSVRLAVSDNDSASFLSAVIRTIADQTYDLPTGFTRTEGTWDNLHSGSIMLPNGKEITSGGSTTPATALPGTGVAEEVTGKLYYEVEVESFDAATRLIPTQGASIALGIVYEDIFNSYDDGEVAIGYSNGGDWGVGYYFDIGALVTEGAAIEKESGMKTEGFGTIFGVAIDTDAGKLWISRLGLTESETSSDIAFHSVLSGVRSGVITGTL